MRIAARITRVLLPGTSAIATTSPMLPEIRATFGETGGKKFPA